ncbi:MAG: APC family permease [Puniceicoccales bacterium]|jgi:amino acid transporter|nr:APC family permease [Puniceicoccales bacterium]
MGMADSSASKRYLGVFALTMINFAAIMNLRNLPLLSFYGLGMIFFYLVAALLFFIPAALISAELASIFDEEGGLFAWVSHAIGERAAFVCGWISFITTVTALTMTIIFLAKSMLLAVIPVESQNKGVVCAAVICVVWTATFLALKGINFTSKIVSVASTVGTMLPAFLLVALGIYWWCSGDAIAMDTSPQTILPDFSNFSNVSFITGVMFGFAGIEMSAYYIKNVKNPRKTYPRAIFLATGTILLVSLLGSLAIAVVIPRSEISIEAGAMQAIVVVLESMGLGRVSQTISSLMLIGGTAYIFSWIAGPAMGLYATRNDGFLPKFLLKTNARGMPVAILGVQAALVTILAILSLFVQSTDLFFWIIDVTSSVMMLMLYACLFISGIVLRYKMPEANRLYKVPWGNFGMILLACVAIANVIFCMITSFFIPNDLQDKMSQSRFACVVSVLTLLLLGPALIFTLRRQKPCTKG